MTQEAANNPAPVVTGAFAEVEAAPFAHPSTASSPFAEVAEQPSAGEDVEVTEKVAAKSSKK